jgi:hypothetical protein
MKILRIYLKFIYKQSNVIMYIFVCYLLCIYVYINFFLIIIVNDINSVSF